MIKTPPVAVVETPEFLSATRKLLSEDERIALIDHLARNPDDGDVIQGTGGVRSFVGGWKVGANAVVRG